MQLLEIPPQTPISDVDEEISEIFVEEMEEVLEEMLSSYETWKNDPTETEALKTLRRNFHTLKGSGRLVGATVIGELGWRFENMLNRIIEGTFSTNEKVFFLLDQVGTVLPELIKQFKNEQPASYHVRLLISQADYLTQTKGENLGEFDPPSELEATTNTTPPIEKAEKKAEKSATGETEEPAIQPTSVITTPTAQKKPPAKPLVTETQKPESIFDNQLSEKNSLNSEIADTLELTDLSSDKTEELDWDIENLSTVDFNLDTELNTEFNEEGFNFDAEDLPGLDDFTQENEDLLTDETTLPGEPTTQEKVILPVTGEIEEISEETEEAGSCDPVLFEIFQKEAKQHLANLTTFLSKLEQKSPAKIDPEIMRAFHSLNGSSRSVNLATVSQIAAPLENYARNLLERQVVLSKDMLGHLKQATQLIEQFLKTHSLEDGQPQRLLAQVQTSLESLPAPPSKTESAPATSADDAPDATDEFMAIFLDEAEEILENTQSLLERWQAAPNNMQLMKELQRELHTLKGGARMVGITPMGDLSHQLESVLTRIVEGNAHSSTKLQEIVQNSVDELAAMSEAVRSSVPLEMPTDLIQQIGAALVVDGEESEQPATVIKKPTPIKTTESTPTISTENEVSQKTEPATLAENKLDKIIEKESEIADSAEDRIRVRVSLIDKLTNLAGELSISRAHMEQQQGSLKTNLVEMEQTVIRLRDQLRRLEIETEAQILSHFGDQTTGPDQEEFDPLELDRFSVMQQLSRSLMETVSDLLNIQDFMKTLNRQSDTLLIQQIRIGAELQDGIMRTRMIPFSRISPRLQRIARLTARELRKQVDFVINGEQIEFERTVLNRIVAPLEHMLRNAIGHGVEDAQTRQQAGKPSMAKITVDLAREGSELIIKLSDDGAGLNLQAIRKKAEDRGLIQPDTVISDKDLMQFIMEPSFSTAKTITQVSGRGVGMDVVNTEIKQLGGNLQIFSKTGEGTTFEIRLPLSLTINQALMVHIGEETMAVPMAHVEAVRRIPRQEVLSEENQIRYYQYMDNSYRVFHLGELLGFGKTSSVDNTLMSTIPALLVRAGDRRVGLLVDGIEGNKEIVVKSVGPQISAIRWVAGATILGDGRVVLILDIPTLTRVETGEQYLQPQPVVEKIVEEKSSAKAIMVVDDSITVRKVTARLLKRQGMEVVTAKDGVDAITQLQDKIPDLMLLDVEMPRMDGYELATQVRNNPEWKHIPIIMITSRTGAKHRDKAEKIGINRYLGKPFNETELLENITNLLAETIRTH
jgi:chemosensory pili system protein ChpA (sensor histidine kinase/response regulator)